MFFFGYIKFQLQSPNTAPKKTFIPAMPVSFVGDWITKESSFAGTQELLKYVAKDCVIIYLTSTCFTGARELVHIQV